MNRRSFFNTMLGTAPTVAATLAMTSPVTQHGAVEFLQPMCPSCACLFDVTALVPLGPNESFGERARRGCTPIDTTCQYCGWQGSITFYRRQ